MNPLETAVVGLIASNVALIGAGVFFTWKVVHRLQITSPRKQPAAPGGQGSPAAGS